ncbi:MAG: ABC transporter substrate-binding protein [Hormoscilla sp.]
MTSKTQRTQQLVLPLPSNPSTFNFAINQKAYTPLVVMYKGLVTENRMTGELEPALAESWDISPDGRRITFTLRQGLKWSDGQPLTADDVLFTFQEVYLNRKIPTRRRDFLRIGNRDAFPSVRQLDSRRVEFILPEPFAPFVRYMTRMAILPAHALRKSVRTLDSQGNPQFLSLWGTDTDPRKIICNGPYRLVSYSPEERAILERNPYYWRKDDRGNPMPYIDRVVLPIIESTDNQLLRFRSGEFDLLRVTPEAFELLKRESKRGKYTIYNNGPEIGLRFIEFNLNQGRNAKGKPFVDPIKSRWFNTLAFRQAVAHAIDRDRMKNNIYRGLAEVLHSTLAVSSPYYLSPAAGLKVYNYNPQKAKQLLLGAGFKYNREQELLDWDGNRVEFNILVISREKARIDAAVQIQQDLSKIGIKTNLQVLSTNTVLKKLLRTRDWECYVGIFGIDGAAVEPNLLSFFWSSSGSFHQFNQGPQPGQPPIAGWVSDWEREIDRSVDGRG